MITCEIDPTTIEDACFNLDGIADLLINLAEVAETGATQINYRSLYFLAMQVREQGLRIDKATAADTPPNVAAMPQQANAN